MLSSSQDECRFGSGVVNETVSRPTRYAPFIWQSGSRLLIMDRMVFGWAIAEFAFNDRLGQYEVRREATYDSPREASGVLLATVIAADSDVRDSLASRLSAWVGEQLGVV